LDCREATATATATSITPSITHVVHNSNHLLIKYATHGAARRYVHVFRKDNGARGIILHHMSQMTPVINSE